MRTLHEIATLREALDDSSRRPGPDHGQPP